MHWFQYDSVYVMKELTELEQTKILNLVDFEPSACPKLTQ